MARSKQTARRYNVNRYIKKYNENSDFIQKNHGFIGKPAVQQRINENIDILKRHLDTEESQNQRKTAKYLRNELDYMTGLLMEVNKPNAKKAPTKRKNDRPSKPTWGCNNDGCRKSSCWLYHEPGDLKPRRFQRKGEKPVRYQRRGWVMKASCLGHLFS